MVTKRDRVMAGRRRASEAPVEVRRRAAAADPDACPRCGEPVVYLGRGRRPIWCSARCRTHACIERRGNRMVGIEPLIVEVQRERKAPATPPAVHSFGSRRRIEDWVEHLEGLRLALGSGAVYDRAGSAGRTAERGCRGGSASASAPVRRPRGHRRSGPRPTAAFRSV